MGRGRNINKEGNEEWRGGDGVHERREEGAKVGTRQ